MVVLLSISHIERLPPALICMYLGQSLACWGNRRHLEFPFFVVALVHATVYTICRQGSFLAFLLTAKIAG